MKERAEKAASLFREGYCCSQAVVLAFSDMLGTDRETLLKISSSFGGGMGRLREVCGAVSGMFIVAGLLYGFGEPDREAKTAHYRLIQSLAASFTEKNGSIVCRELLGISGKSAPIPEERTAEYYKMRPCERMIYDAADIMSDYIALHEAEEASLT